MHFYHIPHSLCFCSQVGKRIKTEDFGSFNQKDALLRRFKRFLIQFSYFSFHSNYVFPLQLHFHIYFSQQNHPPRFLDNISTVLYSFILQNTECLFQFSLYTCNDENGQDFMDVHIYLRLSLPDPVVPPPGLAEVGPVPGILRVPSISTHQA